MDELKEERAFVERVLKVQGVNVVEDDMFSYTNWQYFYYDPQTMRFALRPVIGIHKRLRNPWELIPNYEQCKQNLWHKPDIVLLMDVFDIGADDYVVGQRCYMNLQDFFDLYPDAHSLLKAM